VSILHRCPYRKLGSILPNRPNSILAVQCDSTVDPWDHGRRWLGTSFLPDTNKRWGWRSARGGKASRLLKLEMLKRAARRVGCGKRK